MTTFSIIENPPTVIMIGATRPIVEGIQQVMQYRDAFWETDPIENDPLALVEFGGRVCYESFDNKRKRSRLDYIRDTAINKQHGSIAEHAWFNFAVLDLPRNALMELTRHRVGVAYSWRSTRYVDSWITYAMPPLYRGNVVTGSIFKEFAKLNFQQYIDLKETQKTLTPDLPRKEIIEAARSILAGSATSDGEFTVNLRSLMHIYNLRSDPGADASMQEFAHALYAASREIVAPLLENQGGTS